MEKRGFIKKNLIQCWHIHSGINTIFLKFLLNYRYDNIVLETAFFPTPQNLLAPSIP